ncbi:MAG: helix-turn-helix transcriptional regulator [Clostridia bacterium]|nr:helix-turn-helix transcriptional regulator [Clostridia bacterium]
METKFKQIRKDAGISQDTLARELGVSKSCISAWENGTRHPGGEHLLSYIKLFNLDADFFDDGLPKKSNAQKCFDMTILNAKGAKKMYDYYLSLIENEEYLKKS